MKKSLLSTALLLALLACQSPNPQRVLARFVPERMDDFVFENDLVAGRFYGEALEGNPTSPGIDIWVKKAGKLVANDWYQAAQSDPDYYHHDHGGKDCYKVAVSLGGGASAVLVDGALALPKTNFRSYELLYETPDSVAFVLHYPLWEASDAVQVSLDKTVRVRAGSYFCDVEDCYRFSGADSLEVAAGINRHPAQETIVQEFRTADAYAIWERASDQSIEAEDGCIGVAIHVPGARFVRISEDAVHALVGRTIRSGEIFAYSFASCWSKGEIKTAADWFEKVAQQ